MIPETSKLQRKDSALITGAGSGLGRALSIEFAKRGYPVVGFDRHDASLRETATLAGSNFHSRVVDVGDAIAIRNAVVQSQDDLGPISILVNNAAVYPRRDFLQETTASFMHTVAINLGGYVACTHAVLETMQTTGIGRILNVGSFADIAPVPCSAAYSVSKGAARVLTRALVADLSDRFPDIIISDWMPGVLSTNMGLPDGIDPAVAAVWGVNLALWRDRTLNGVGFERDTEILAPRGLKQRVKNLVFLRSSPEPRRLNMQT